VTSYNLDSFQRLARPLTGIDLFDQGAHDRGLVLFFEFRAPSSRATILLHPADAWIFDIDDKELERITTDTHCAFWGSLHLPNVKRVLIPTTSGGADQIL
jgi:hypothetical protein